MSALQADALNQTWRTVLVFKYLYYHGFDQASSLVNRFVCDAFHPQEKLSGWRQVVPFQGSADAKKKSAVGLAKLEAFFGCGGFPIHVFYATILTATAQGISSSRRSNSRNSSRMCKKALVSPYCVAFG